jgi:DNA-binding protein H-NS
MPAPPGMSEKEAEAIKEKQKAKAKADAEKKKVKADYQKKYADPSTVEELVEANEVDNDWFKDGDWRPGWGHVEFVSSLS